MFERKVTVRNIEFREGEAIVTLGTNLGADNTHSTHVESVDVPDQGCTVDLIVLQAKLALLRKTENLVELLSHSDWNQISGSFEYKPPKQ